MLEQCVQDLARCLVGVDLMVLPVDFTRDVLELRERAVVALGHITSGLPPHDISGMVINPPSCSSSPAVARPPS